MTNACDNPKCPNHGCTKAAWNDPLPEGYQRIKLRDEVITVCFTCEAAIDLLIEAERKIRQRLQAA